MDFGDGNRLSRFAPVEGRGESNELGLTVLAGSGEFDALITGDMGGDTERRLLALTELPDLELLVAGHHGSAGSTTSELLETTGPELALISVGAGNRYGHPAQDTLVRLNDAGAAIYRTDLHGTILVNGRG